MRLVALFGLALSLSACVDFGANSRSEFDSVSSEGKSVQVVKLDGNYRGFSELPGGKSTEFGFIVDGLPESDGSSIAIAIRYTNIVKDRFLANLLNRIDRIVDYVRVYKLVPAGSPGQFTLLPADLADGEGGQKTLAFPKDDGKHYSVLTVTDTGRPANRIAPSTKVGHFLRGINSQFKAVISAGHPDVGEPAEVTFDTFLSVMDNGQEEKEIKSERSTSTWDPGFLADGWKLTYFGGELITHTFDDAQGQRVELKAQNGLSGAYEMQPVLSMKSAGNEEESHIYRFSASGEAAGHPLSDRYGIFIDVRNRKNIRIGDFRPFTTRELFVVNPKNPFVAKPAENPNGTLMYVQKSALVENLKESVSKK